MADTPAVRDALAKAEVHRHADTYVIEGIDWTYLGAPVPTSGWHHPGCEDTHPLTDVFHDLFGDNQLGDVLKGPHPGPRTDQLTLFGALVRAEINALQEHMTYQEDMLKDIVAAGGAMTRDQEEDFTVIARATTSLLSGLHGALYPERSNVPAQVLGVLDERTSGANYLLFELSERFASVSYADVGRNDQCPCGSGAKFKHCHGRR